MENDETPSSPADQSADEIRDSSPSETTDVQHRDLAEWRGTELIDREGVKIGALQDVKSPTKCPEARG